jgi:two-component system chemotaxis sensor kinase CheA
LKQSIILKTLLILGSVIITIFVASSYLINQNDKQLIDEIRKYNLNTTMKTLDKTEESQLNANKAMMLDSAKMIAKNSSVFLINFDKEGLRDSLAFDINKEGIKAIIVFDILMNENFLVAFKDGKNIKFTTTLPKKYLQYTKIKTDIEQQVDDEKQQIGNVTLFYDESIIKQQIKLLKETTKKEIDQFNQTTDLKLTEAKQMKLFINIGSLLLILLVSTILLIVFVNNPLRKLKIGLDSFFLFLQNKIDSTKQIELDSNDEFGAMARSLNENISVSAKLHEEIHELNSNLEAKVEEKTAKVTTLLDNAGQGFLTFDNSFLVDMEYSKECEKLLGDDIVSKDITKLLFKDETKQKLFKDSLLNAQKETMPIKRNSYISLIPKIILLNKKAVKLEYKLVDNDSKFMMILTNITSEKRLEKKVKKEQEILKMIVAIVSESETFYENRYEYQKFIDSAKELVQMDKTPLYNLTNLYRTVHTFKGAFSQLYMQDIVSFLHALESDLSLMQKDTSSTNEELVDLLESQDFNNSLNKTLNIIEEILGEDFLESENYIKVDLGDIESLQEKIENILNGLEHTTPECKDILCSIQNLSSSKLSTLLNPNISSVKQLAVRLEKEIYELDIIGDNKLVVNDSLKPFIKSLIHVFRNSVDHGIETAEKRLEIGKDEIGTISCSFEQKNDTLHIIIADDGAGINTQKIKNKLNEKGIETDNLTDNEIFDHIFDDSLSTKDVVCDISGRGVGMSAVKNECKKIGGEINITSSKDHGTTFEFVVPLIK